MKIVTVVAARPNFMKVAPFNTGASVLVGNDIDRIRKEYHIAVSQERDPFALNYGMAEQQSDVCRKFLRGV